MAQADSTTHSHKHHHHHRSSHSRRRRKEARGQAWKLGSGFFFLCLLLLVMYCGVKNINFMSPLILAIVFVSLVLSVLAGIFIYFFVRKKQKESDS